MTRKTCFLGFATMFVLLATVAEAKTWYAYHASYHGASVSGYGYHTSSSYGYGASRAVSPYAYGGYHYGGNSEAHYGYYRRW